MLYLNNLFYLLKKNPIRISLYLVATSLMFFVFLAEEFLDRQISNRFSFQLDEESYFTALISTKENYNMVVRKMVNLPGVEKVKVIGPEELNEKISKVISSLKINLSPGSGGLSTEFVGMKVFFEDGIREKSKELIRSYISKLAGETSLFLGNTVSNDDLFRGYKNIYKNIKRITPVGIKVFAVIFWLYCISILKAPFLSILVTAQKYQRSKNLALKTAFLSNIALTIALILIIVLLERQINYMNVLVLLAIICSGTIYLSKKLSWG